MKCEKICMDSLIEIPDAVEIPDRLLPFPFGNLASRKAAFRAAACGQPERLRCEFRFGLTWPLPLQLVVGHFNIISCIANTINFGAAGFYFSLQFFFFNFIFVYSCAWYRYRSGGMMNE